MSNEVKKIPEVSVWRFLKHSTQILKNPLPFHRQNFEKHGDTFRLLLPGNKSVVFSRDAEFLQHALQKNQKNFTKSPIQTKDLSKYVGQGLLTAEGNHWKKQRKLIQPAFHKKQIFQLLDTIQSVIAEEMKRFQPGKPIDIFPVFNDLAFKTVVKSLFKTAVSDAEINRLQQITEEAQKMLVRELRQPYKLWWFRLSGQIQHHINLTDEARQILLKLVRQRQQSQERPGDLLDMLLDAKYEDGTFMSEEQLLDEILILFVAGHETTSNALTFTAQLLAKNQEVQDRVYEEVQSAKSESVDPLEMIKALPYTNQVVEESLRLYPPAYFIDRENIETDYFGGFEIPKGTSLLFSVIEIHRHAGFWERPLAFDPDRFAEGNSLKYSAFYYPFGAGSRMCIGNNFAMYEMVLAVAEMVSKFKILEKKSPIEILPLITLKPKNALLEFERR
ncbi:MAG: cytochrome P450 [Leeuwenhoekiella sp.]